MILFKLKAIISTFSFGDLLMKVKCCPLAPIEMEISRFRKTRLFSRSFSKSGIAMNSGRNID